MMRFRRGNTEAAQRHLGQGRRLRSPRCLPLPQRDHERRESEDHERVEGLEPRRRYLGGPYEKIHRPVGIGVGPQGDRIALLLVSRPEQGVGHEKNDQGCDGAPFVTVERLSRDARRLRLLQFVRRQQRHGVEIDSEPDQHADAGGGKPVVPAGELAERAADQRRQECADIDADVEDGIGAVAARVAGC